MADENPYAAPADDQLAGSPPGELEKQIWRKGRTLVLERGAQLPQRCVKCNRSHDLLMKPRRFTCTSFNLALSAKATTILVTICRPCNRRRQRTLAWGAVIAILGLVVLSLGIAFTIPQVALSSVPLLLLGLGLGYRSQLVVASRIDRKKIHLVGICREYLSELTSHR